MNCFNCKKPNSSNRAVCMYCGTALATGSSNTIFTEDAPESTGMGNTTDQSRETLYQETGREVRRHPSAPPGGASAPRSSGQSAVVHTSDPQAALKALLGDRHSMRRQIVATSALTLLALSVPIGWLTMPMLLGTGILLVLGMFLPVGFMLTGRLPFARIIGGILGPEASFRRSIILSALCSLPLFFLYFHSDGISFPSVYRSLVTFGVMYYLTGFVSVWKGQDQQFRFVGGLGQAADDVLKKILGALSTQPLQPLNVQVRDILEGPSFSMSSDDIRRRTTRIIEVTQDRARVVIRCIDYGGHLYVRWDTFVDLSGIRFTLFVKAIFSLINNFVLRWGGSDLTVWFRELRDIMIGSNETTGGQEMQTTQFNIEMIPSYVLDNAIELGQLAGLVVVEQVLNPLLEQAQRPERLAVSQPALPQGRSRIL